MKKYRQIIMYATIEEKNVVDIKISRDMSDDETVLLFSHLYAKSLSFARIFNAMRSFKDSLKMNEERAQEYLKLLDDVTVEE